MNQLTTFVRQFPNGRQALVVRTAAEVTPVAVAEAPQLPPASGVLLLSGGAGLMPIEVALSGQDRIRERLAAVARAGRITLLDLSGPPAELAGSVRMYHVEDALYPRDAAGELDPRKKPNFSDLKSRLPGLFITLYAVYGLILLVVLGLCGLQGWLNLIGLG